jgi:hypothetical protein
MDIVDLNAERERRRKSNGEPLHGLWMFTVQVYAPLAGETRYSGTLDGFSDGDGLTAADRLREYAGALADLSWQLRAHAHAMEPDKDGRVLSHATIYESGRVITWTSDVMQSVDQIEWLRARYDIAQRFACWPAQEEPGT